MDKIKPRAYGELINSFRFYFMLGICLTSKDVPASHSSESLKSYIKDLRKDFSDEVINYNMMKAYKSLPSEFLNLHHIEINPDDRFIKMPEAY